MTLLKVIVPGCLEQDSEVEMFQFGRTERFGLRGGLSGLGGAVIGFGNGFAGGSPRGGSGAHCVPSL
jgi:hypothetical protein